jgi:hypothetical protein
MLELMFEDVFAIRGEFGNASKDDAVSALAVGDIK